MENSLAVVARIDVLIPAYNAEATVVESVKSILNQTVRDIRVVVVNDGSTDRTAEALTQLALTDARLVVHSQSNGGIVDALNNGLALCAGELVARHDADDIAFADRLETQLAYLDANPDCIAVGANAFHIDETGRRTGSITNTIDPALADVNRIPADEPYLMHPFLMVRRESLLKIGGYRHVFHAEDADLYWRLSAVGRLHNMDNILGEYRIHSGSVSGKSVLNGRVQSVNSQLAALSERRRAKGLPDLAFPRARLQRFHEARSLPAIMSIAEEELHPQELPQFRLAVVAKLLESESYRPYTLDKEDRAFVKQVFAEHSHLLSARDRRFLARRQAKYITKRIRGRDFSAVLQFIRPTLVPAVAALFSNAVLRRVYKPWKW